MTTKLKGNGILSIAKRYTNFKRDLKNAKVKIIDIALKEQYQRNRTSSTLTGVKEIAKEYLEKNYSYTLNDGEQCCVQDRVSDYFNMTYKFSEECYEKWHKKLPNIFDFSLKEHQTNHFTTLQEEFNLPQSDVDSTMYSVHIVNADGEVIRVLKMSPDDVIQKLL